MPYSVDKLKKELTEQEARFAEYLKQLRTGRVTTEAFENMKVEAYNSVMDLKSVASVTTDGPSSVVILPYDKNIAKEIEKAVIDSPLGYVPSNEGDKVRINIPPLTTETRDEIIKQMYLKVEEDFKKRIRQIRQDHMQVVDKMEGSEDDRDVAKKQIQKEIDSFTAKFDEMAAVKEAEIKPKSSI